MYTGAYIGTGDHNGFYTLHLVRAAKDFYKDSYIKNLGRDWDEVHTKFTTYCQHMNAVPQTSYDSQWELNEWGSGGTTDWSVARYMEWKVMFAAGLMPFSKERNKPLNELTPSFRDWLRCKAAENIATGSKFQARSWQLVIDALVPWAVADADFMRRFLAERDAAQEARKVTSQHVGSVGERLTRNLKCVARYKGFSAAWGDMVIYKLIDEAGNSYTTFGNCPLEKDAEFTPVKFTVKRHGEYKGEKQTVINRLKAVKG